MRTLTLIAKLMLSSTLLLGPVFAQDEAPAPPDDTEAVAEAADAEEAVQATRTTLGMSILGNEEAPKSLVIVPWKSSRIGDGLGVSNSMDDRPTPVDREVFMREVRYYELRSGDAQ